MKKSNLKIYWGDGSSEAYEDYHFPDIVERYLKRNNLFVGGTLEALKDYLILPALINQNFEKFIKKFFSTHTCFNLKSIEKHGEIYIVTVRNIKEKESQKIVWVLKNYFLSKSININFIRFVKRTLKKYNANTAVIVSTTSVLCSTSLKVISNSRYSIFFIDKKILNKYPAWLSYLRLK